MLGELTMQHTIFGEQEEKKRVGAALIKHYRTIATVVFLVPRGRFFSSCKKPPLQTDDVRRFPLGAPPQRQFRQYHLMLMHASLLQISLLYGFQRRIPAS